LRMSDQDNGGVISSVNQFLPYAFQLMNSVLQASEGVRLEAKLEFKWESGLSTARGGRRMAENSDPALMFDLGMAVAAKALALGNLATLAAGDLRSGAGGAGPAVAHLREAAGLWAWVAAERLPERYAHAECAAAVAEGLGQWCLARAQLAAAAQMALKYDASKDALLAKLCVGAAQMIKRAVDGMRARAGPQYERLPAPFLAQLALSSSLAQGLAYLYVARAAAAEQRAGLAVAAIRRAQELVGERAGPAAVGLPPLDGPLQEIQGEVAALRAHIQRTEAAYNKDNSSVYFLPVPDGRDVELPGAVTMKQATPFAPPELPPLDLEGRGASASSSGEKAEGEEGKRERTDSDLARELQEKLNAGEDI